MSGRQEAPLFKSYVLQLEEKLNGSKNIRKGKRRELTLLLSAARILESQGYYGLSVDAIIANAKVSRGTYYIYFKNKSEIALRVLTDFRDCVFSDQVPDLSTDDWEEKLYITILHYAKLHEANDKLFRAFYQFTDEAAQFREMRQRTDRIWAVGIYEKAFSKHPRLEDPEFRLDMLRKISALRDMLDGVCRQVYLDRAPQMVELFPTPKHVADTCVGFWKATIASAFVEINLSDG